MTTFWQDLRYGFRTLAKQRGFTALMILTLGLGIGATTTIFSVVNTVLLQPLAFKEPDRLVMIWRNNFSQQLNQFLISALDYKDFRAQSHVFEDISAFTPVYYAMMGQGEPEQLHAVLVSPSFFSLLGVQAAVGRAFSPEDIQSTQGKFAAISYGLWQRRFGADAAVIGKAVTLNGVIYTLVAVMPRHFQFPPEFDLNGGIVQYNPDIWLSLDLDTARKYENFDLTDRSLFLFYALARLKPGATLEQARTEIQAINEQLQSQYPDLKGWGVDVISLHEEMVGDVRPALRVLFGAVVFVLLIACANAANLLLVRGAGRQKEMAIRAAVGASRARIIRQLLTESLALAFMAGAVGLLLTYLGLRLLIVFSPATMPYLKDSHIDPRVLGFTFIISLLTGMIFGLFPALQAAKPNLEESLREGSRGMSGGAGRQRIRRLLVVSEISLALVLLVGAGLMIKSFLRLQSTDPGFSARNVLTMLIRLNTTKYAEPDQRTRFFKQVRERVENLPGVEAAGATDSPPFAGLTLVFSFEIQGQPPVSVSERPLSNWHWVSASYFETMRIPLVEGRFFTEHDAIENHRVAIINETLARRFMPGEDPIGKRISLVEPPDSPVWLEVVGVARDVKYNKLNAAAIPDIYGFSLQPYPGTTSHRMTLIIRTSVEPLSLTSAVRREVLAVDKDQPTFDIKSMGQYIADSIAKQRLNMLLLGIFAAVALILAAIGIYGVVSYTVAQRTREIGIRVALGAQKGDVLRLILGQGLAMALIGIVVGLAVAFALTRVLASLLYEVSTTDAATFAAVSMLLAGMTLLACYLPARRAMKVEPMIALRYE
jgi:predicted permease